jgi:hypothetical protein
MKKALLPAVALTISVAWLLVISGCFGSFSLVRNVYKFNEGFGDKWVQEVGFVLMSIVPVYEGAAIIDALILNSVEFWTGNKPVATTIKGDDDKTQITYNAKKGSIRYAREGTEYVFEKSSEGAIVKDKDGKFVVLCQATGDGGMVLKDENGRTVASYTPAQVNNLYTKLESVH